MKNKFTNFEAQQGTHAEQYKTKKMLHLINVEPCEFEKIKKGKQTFDILSLELGIRKEDSIIYREILPEADPENPEVKPGYTGEIALKLVREIIAGEKEKIKEGFMAYEIF